MRFCFADDSIEGFLGEGDERYLAGYLKPIEAAPVKPRLSATVMLLRDSVPGQTKYRLSDESIEAGGYPANFPEGQKVEVFMLRRAKTMAFVPDAVVFPGGSVDKRDANPRLPWFGPSPAEWAMLMDCPEEDARQVLVAAAREVFEEAGVLLAGPDGESTVATMDDPGWLDIRAALERHERSFAEVLIEKDLVLRTDLLGLVLNLQTPASEPRRYDTYFFTALMPECQEAAGHTSEAQIADWVTPAYAVNESDYGRWRVVPPTMIALTKLAAANSAAEFVQARVPVHRATLRAVYVDSEGMPVCEYPMDATEPADVLLADYDRSSLEPRLRWCASDKLVASRADFAEGER